MKGIYWIALFIIILSAINWGIWGIFQFDLIAAIYHGRSSPMTRLLDSIIGLSAVYVIYYLKGILFPEKQEEGSFISRRRIIDLTHPLNEKIQGWSKDESPFVMEVIKDHPGYLDLRYHIRAGCGTHIDAPLHFVPKGADLASLSLESLCTPLVVLDISHKATPDYFVTLQDIHDFERKYGEIEKNSLVLIYSGWEERWHSAELYTNEDEKGVRHFPGCSEEAASWLLKRKVVGLGIDTRSIDGSNISFPIHTLFLGQGKYLLENMANLSALPPKGSFGVILPLKIEGGAESPVRAIAFIDK